ncbi:Small heat shock protein C4 [Grifola frondosa]|uniref:Small heat shock protein C4 n=1 Tax=Grifola frondosa TaxID=5627 RepID=A0A1C7LUD9_GRIFR|nr:Small heat shock protein C4 [Grifola frondosa]
MSLVNRWFAEPAFALSDFDRLFDDAFARATAAGPLLAPVPTTPRALRPRMDLHEDEKANTVTATFELPGLKKDDVQIEVRNNVLTISGESKISSEREESGYSVRERHYGKFSRSVSLPEGAKASTQATGSCDPNDIKANMDSGVLTVTYPRSTPQAETKRITIA